MKHVSRAALIIHGHFYQPPRENPWTDEVERQPSATPYHDWNERIAAECYTPNGWARLLDSEGRITGLINNYQGISFDIGPTLFRWLERHTPETYRRIIEADHESRARSGNHGNAIAQPYVHAILPLIDSRDRSTIVKWGIVECRARFGREPEGMWLPETAVDQATLQVLADNGILFTILAPSQAVRVRSTGQERWTDLGEEGIDPRYPYRCLLPGGRSIDLFFYDAALSRAVAFENLLQDPGRLTTRLLELARHPSNHSLFSICTDGESYGHHSAFGERALAALLARGTAPGDPVITNFGAYLEAHPPTREVMIREGSSWSCAHGLGRWKEDCGCSTGGQPGWRQGWRVHLRAAVEGLREELQHLFVEHGAPYLKDVWEARDGYISLRLDHSDPNVEAYLGKYARRSLSPEERAAAMQLLEMQRHALLMQTSCGWFFADISGVEPVQNLMHAARAIELASAFTSRNIEAGFLSELQMAKSNIPVERDGRRIWEIRVRTAKLTFDRLATLYAALSLVNGLPEPFTRYAFDLHRLALERRPTMTGMMIVGGVEIRSSMTLERREIGFLLRWSDMDGLSGYLFPWRGSGELERWREASESEDEGALPPDHAQAVPVSLKILSEEERQDILMTLYRGRVEEVHKGYDELATRTRGLLHAFLDQGFSPPESLRIPAEHVLARDLKAGLQKWLADGSPDTHRAVLALADEARRLGLRQKDDLQVLLSGSLITRMRRLRGFPNLEEFRGIQDILDLTDRLDCSFERSEIVFLMNDILGHIVPPMIDLLLQTESRQQYDLVSALLRLGERFGFATAEFRQRLRPMEERMAADPGLWP